MTLAETKRDGGTASCLNLTKHSCLHPSPSAVGEIIALAVLIFPVLIVGIIGLIVLGIISLTMGFGVVLGLIIMGVGVIIIFKVQPLGIAFFVIGLALIFLTSYDIIDLSFLTGGV